MFSSFIATVLATDEVHGPIEQIARQFGVNWPSLLAQVLNFCILAFLLYKFAVKPILLTLDERQKTIIDGLKYAEDMKAQLSETENKCEALLKAASLQAQVINEKAEMAAKTYMDQMIHEARISADDLLRKAKIDIDRERNQMLIDVRHAAVDLVLKTTEMVLVRELTAEDRLKFQETAMKALVS